MQLEEGCSGSLSQSRCRLREFEDYLYLHRRKISRYVTPRLIYLHIFSNSFLTF